MIARLLEDGDGADLAWLCEAVPEADLASWVVFHGGRKLSRRSRAFWKIVLEDPVGRSPHPPDPPLPPPLTPSPGEGGALERNPLWPL